MPKGLCRARLLAAMAASSWALLAAGVGSGGLRAQSTWQMEGGRMHARVDGAAGAQLAPSAVTSLGDAALADGAFSVHFPTNAAGKPRSLSLDVPKGASVVVGVQAAGPAERRPVDVHGAGAFEDTLSTPRSETPIHLRTVGESAADLRDYRLSARVRPGKGCEMFALVGRHTSQGGCYLFAIDWSARKVRLERFLGGDHFVVRQADLPVVDREVTLTLQVHGFRIEGLVDDAPMVRSFDGAISAGAPGIAWSGERPDHDEVWLEQPAEPLGSAAVVQNGRAASLHAAVAEPPGSLAVVELLLDRPHRWIPRGPDGFEPWLRQPLAAPVIAWGDWRHSLGSNTISEVDYDGNVRVELRWPDLPALRLHAALVRVRIATPDGGPIVGSSPPVRIVF
ncbi:MAG: hypothetical protein ACE37K_17200 [Planctomycetota bacterium]